MSESTHSFTKEELRAVIEETFTTMFDMDVFYVPKMGDYRKALNEAIEVNISAYYPIKSLGSDSLPGILEGMTTASEIHKQVRRRFGRTT